MKGVSSTQVKEFLVVYINSGGSIASNTHFATKAEADDFSARTVAQNKGGEALVYTAGSVTKLPTPDVVTTKIDIEAAK
jgi:hypothetical protein